MKAAQQGKIQKKITDEELKRMLETGEAQKATPTIKVS